MQFNTFSDLEMQPKQTFFNKTGKRKGRKLLGGSKGNAICVIFAKLFVTFCSRSGRSHS